MKKWATRLIAVILLLLMCLSLVQPAFALDFNGESSSGGGGGTLSNEYGTLTDGTALKGFRFTLVDEDNNRQGNSIDVFTRTNVNYISDHKRFDLKQSKAWWINNYQTVTSVTTSKNTENCYYQSDAYEGVPYITFATKLPSIKSSDDIDTLSADLDAWQQNYQNINILLSYIGSEDVVDFTDLGNHKIIIEPIIWVRLKGGVQHNLTVTELAFYGGGFEYNGNFDKTPKIDGATSGSFNYIANYTNRYFPNYMRTETAACNWVAAPELTARTSFKNIIALGYGANVLSTNTMGFYTVSYDGNGATAGSMDPSTVTDGQEFMTKQNAFSRKGYKFTGWNTSADGSGTAWSLTTPGVYESGQPIIWSSTENLTLYAQWEPITYTVLYDGNGQTGGSTEASVHYYDEARNLTANGFTRTGYTFTGWNTAANGSGTAYADQASVINLCSTDIDTITLYAQWKSDTDDDDINITGSYGYLRFIKDGFFENLDATSKWRLGSLKTLLQAVLSNDLSDLSGCEQVWHFTADEYEEAREWCLSRGKGSKTNKDFLTKYAGTNRE